VAIFSLYPLPPTAHSSLFLSTFTAPLIAFYNEESSKIQDGFRAGITPTLLSAPNDSVSLSLLIFFLHLSPWLKPGKILSRMNNKIPLTRIIYTREKILGWSWSCHNWMVQISIPGAEQ